MKMVNLNSFWPHKNCHFITESFCKGLYQMFTTATKLRSYAIQTFAYRANQARHPCAHHHLSTYTQYLLIRNGLIFILVRLFFPNFTQLLFLNFVKLQQPFLYESTLKVEIFCCTYFLICLEAEIVLQESVSQLIKTYQSVFLSYDKINQSFLIEPFLIIRY